MLDPLFLINSNYQSLLEKAIEDCKRYARDHLWKPCGAMNDQDILNIYLSSNPSHFFELPWHFNYRQELMNPWGRNAFCTRREKLVVLHGSRRGFTQGHLWDWVMMNHSIPLGTKIKNILCPPEGGGNPDLYDELSKYVN